MDIKNIVLSQYQAKVDKEADRLKNMTFPPEGWICTTRKALGMSAAQLARRIGKTRALISNTEKAELEGRVTLKTMQKLAESMECCFVYAIVPKENVESVLEARAKEKAKSIVDETNKHMALENQALTKQQIEYEVKRLKDEMLKNVPADFWDDVK